MSSGFNEVHYNNKGAIFTFHKKSKWIGASLDNKNIHRVIRTVKAILKGTPLIHHVQAHQDEVKVKWNLTLHKVLNDKCNNLSKVAINKASHDNMTATNIRLLEAECVFITNHK